jgi:hypothetical protein
MGDGTRFVDPDHVVPGWRLVLPAAEALTRDTRRARGAQVPDHLPELLALGIGSLTCAALARRSRRRRDIDRFRGSAIPPRPLSDEAVDVATLVQRFEGAPVLGAFEAANCLLGNILGAERAGAPTVRAICVGPHGVTFHLASTPGDTPPGFEALHGGAAWHVGHTALHAGHEVTPYLPIVLPVGDDEEGTWLVPLRAGEILPVLGESSESLWRAARTAQESWEWADVVFATEDPLTLEARHRSDRAGRSVRRHDPSAGSGPAPPPALTR